MMLKCGFLRYVYSIYVVATGLFGVRNLHTCSYRSVQNVFFATCMSVHVSFYSSATNVTVRIPVPKATTSSSHEPLGPGQTTDLKLTDKTFVWKLKKLEGGIEHILILKVGSGGGHT